MLTRGRLLVCAATAAAALAVSACGGDGGGVDSSDPASLAPADAPLYIQATIRPQGQEKANVEALASTVSGLDDPTGRLIELLDEALNEEPPISGERLSFDRDIDPWLGQRAGIFVEGFSEDPGAAIVQTTDPEAARQFVEDAKTEGDTDRTYEGVDYVLGDDTAAGVVDDFLVFGDEPALKRAIDVSKGDDSLGDRDDFTSTVEEASSGSVADLYVSIEDATEAIRADDPDDARSLEVSIGDTSGKTALVSLVPARDSLAVDAITNVEAPVELGDLRELIGSFPADSFAAVGVPDLGGIVDRTIGQLEEAGVEGVSREAIDAQLSGAGLSLDDITSALGDLGIFATGSDRSSLQGAAVITSGDPEQAENLISKLTAITGLAQISGQRGIEPAPVGNGISIRDPEELGRQPLIVTTEGGRIAIGYGQQATERALAGGGDTLADDPTFKQAVAALGDTGVSGYVALPAVFRLADALGAIADPGYQQARPYLERLSYAVVGSGERGDFATSKIIIGVGG